MVQYAVVGIFIGSLLVATSLLMGYFVFPPIIKTKVAENVKIMEDTDQFSRWERVPQPLEFKVYFFNVTNVAEIQSGGKPRVKEIGPYIYSQFRRKYNIQFSDDRDTVTYTQQQKFFFNARASAPLSENDNIVVLNLVMNTVFQMIESQIRDTIFDIRNGVNNTLESIPLVNVIKRIIERTTPLQTILQRAESESAANLGFINGELNRVFNRPDSMFVRTTPKDYLFDGVPFCTKPVIGIAAIICKQIQDARSNTIQVMEDGSLKFALFAYKNETNDGIFIVNTGLKDPKLTGQVVSWKGSRTLKQWLQQPGGRPSSCNMINGTDASNFPPFLNKDDDVYIFSSDICRSVKVAYSKDSSYENIPSMQYRTLFLNQIGPEYGNECFCTNQINKGITRSNGCLYRGALDVSTCLNAPIVITHPHMLGAAPEYTQLIDGFEPDFKKHQITLDIEPHTGSPLRGGKRVQFNMFLRRVDSIAVTRNLRTTLFPVVWVDEGIELNEQMVNLIKHDLINILFYLDCFQWVSIGVGVALCVLCTIWFFVKRKKVRSQSVDPIFTVQK